MIYDHNHPWYKARWQYSGNNRWNGAWYYSHEIVKNIIPNVETDRSWVTVNIPFENRVPQFDSCCQDHSIVFIHNNLHPENYEWLNRFNDLILVCGIEETMERVEHLGHPIYVPLSVDVDEVKRHRKRKTKDRAFVGRKIKSKDAEFPDGTDIVHGMKREMLLDVMSEYRQIYAVGRTAIEAKILGCEILPYDDRFPDPSIWIVRDNSEAVKILQNELNKIDK